MSEKLYTNTERVLSDGLDFYKLSMGQVAFEKHPDAEVTFTLKNRADAHPLGEYVHIDELQDRFSEIRQKGFTSEEIAYYASLQASDGTHRFDEPYLDYLAQLTLPEVSVKRDSDTNELHITSTGPWANVSLWETVVMNTVNEQYYQHFMEAHDLTTQELYAEGDRRLDEKIAKLVDRPDIKFADFGTRRRFSPQWHEHVLQRLITELPDNFIGTSNPWFAHKYNVPVIGTYAHETPMIYAALADQAGKNPLDGHAEMLDDWQARYKGDLSIALTDTFTTDFFFQDFAGDRAASWKGLRQDSGDAAEFGEKAIQFYESQGIDPKTKAIVFSDGLDVDTIITLADQFVRRIGVTDGWGGDLMNDVGLRRNNIVMKATEVNGISTVKLSDGEGKHTGPEVQVQRYQQLVDEARLAVAGALKETN